MRFRGRGLPGTTVGAVDGSAEGVGAALDTTSGMGALATTTGGGVDIYSYDGEKPVLVHREIDSIDKSGACQRSFYDRIDDELRKTGTGACKDE